MRLGLEEPLLLRDVLLEDVGLQRAVEDAGVDPRRSAATRYMQKTGTAGPLIVIDVVMSSSGRSLNSTSMSAAESMATPVPDLAEAHRVVGVTAHQGRHVERHREPPPPRAMIIL